MKAGVVTIFLAVLLAAPAAATDRPRYDVPAGYAKCPGVTAWNGFFKWASVHRASCLRARRFMRAYATAAEITAGPMPRSVAGYRCTIRYWRDAEGDIYASRHRCTRAGTVIRFYGMV